MLQWNGFHTALDSTLMEIFVSVYTIPLNSIVSNSELVLSLQKQVLTAVIYSNILKTTILSSIITKVVMELYLDNV